MSKLSLKILCLVAVSMTVAYAQQDGRYRPFTTAATKRPLYPALGRYSPNKNDGKYYPSDEGKYSGIQDGKYRPSDEGKYKGTDNASYKPDKTIKTADVYRGRNRFNSRGDYKGATRAPVKAATLVAGKGTSIGGNDFKIVYLYNQEEKDGYHYIYETENGILAEEEGHIEKLTTGDGLRAKGFFEYTGDDGILYRVDYVADDAGFVPQGAHLHPTPPHVIKLLEYLALNAKK